MFPLPTDMFDPSGCCRLLTGCLLIGRFPLACAFPFAYQVSFAQQDFYCVTMGQSQFRSDRCVALDYHTHSHTHCLDLFLLLIMVLWSLSGSAHGKGGLVCVSTLQLSSPPLSLHTVRPGALLIPPSSVQWRTFTLI